MRMSERIRKFLMKVTTAAALAAVCCVLRAVEYASVHGKSSIPRNVCF